MGKGNNRMAVIIVVILIEWIMMGGKHEENF